MSEPATLTLAQVKALEETLNMLTMKVQSLEGATNINPVQTMPVPKVALPEKYDGTPAYFRDFLTSVENYVTIQSLTFQTEESKTRFFGTLLTKEALSWYRTILESKNPIIFKWSAFIEDFTSYFGDAHAQRSAQVALTRLRQGRGPATTYASRFRRVAVDTGFDNQALMDRFRSGLKENVKDALALALDEPKTLEELIRLAIKIDNRLFERETEKAQNDQTLTKYSRRFESQDFGPAPMDIDASVAKVKKLNHVEKQRRLKEGLCFYCGLPGHRANQCNQKKPTKKPAAINAAETEVSSLLYVPVRIQVNELMYFDTHALLDIGCTTNLVSRNLVEEMELPTVQLKEPLPITLADGQTAPTPITQAVEPLSLIIERHTELICPLVADIAHPMILGLPWFRRHNPNINWRSQTLVLNGCPPVCNSTHDSIPLVSSEHVLNQHSYNSVTTQDKAMTKRIEIPMPYQEYKEVFKPTSDIGLPPSRMMDMKIELLPDANLPSVDHIYRLTQPEEKELRSWIDDQLKRKLIVPSKSPIGAPIFFVKKKDGGLRPCIDYRRLNEITVKDKFPLPVMNDLLDRLSGAQVFSTLDLRSAYNLVRIHSGDEWKAAFRCRFGHFEPRVVQFGLVNAPSVFQRLINSIFSDLIDQYVIIYFDDISIYSKDPTSHYDLVKTVLDRLKEKKLYAKLSKYLFDQTAITYLGYHISSRGVQIDPSKVGPLPTNVTDIQSFLGFANFYRRFVPPLLNRLLTLPEKTFHLSGPISASLLSNP
jgi:hypothetical protein